MDKHIWYLIVAVVMIAFLPMVRNMIRMRIIVLRWLRWKWLADFHEHNIDRLVPIARLIMSAIAIVLIILAFGGLHSSGQSFIPVTFG